jgi:GNAT superfamily N-acetyltransferase
VIEFRPEPAGSPVARALLSAMVQEMLELYDAPEMPTPASTADLEPSNGGAFVAGWEDGRPVAGGGLKRMGRGLAEIKRMYVVPDARRRGHARRLLAAIEDVARELGYDRVRLDTGARQPHARALYESAGYEPIPDFNDNPLAAYWGEKALS